MKHTYEISVSLHCCQDDLEIARTKAIEELVGEESKLSTKTEHNIKLDFSLSAKKKFEYAVGSLKDNISDLDYSVFVSAHVYDKNGGCLEHDEFDNSEADIDDLFHLSNMVAEILVRMTNNPHNAAFILSFASGMMSSDFDLDTTEVKSAFEMGFDAGEENKKQETEEEQEMMVVAPPVGGTGNLSN